MNALLVSRSGRIRNCRCVQRRVIMYVRPGRTSRGVDTRRFSARSSVRLRQINLGEDKPARFRQINLGEDKPEPSTESTSVRQISADKSESTSVRTIQNQPRCGQSGQSNRDPSTVDDGK